MKLKVMQPDQAPQIYELGQENVRIGRCPNSDIHLDGTGCSRDHCIIECVQGGYQVVDLGSFNGTKVNGERITTHKLQAQDKIQLGKNLLVFITDSPKPEKVKREPRKRKKSKGKDKGPKKTEQSRRRRPVRRVNKFAQSFFLTYVAFLLAWVGHKVETQVNVYNKELNRYNEAVQLMEQDKEAAEKIFQEVIKAVPGTKLADKALSAIANVQEEKEGEKNPENSDFKELVAKFKNRRISAQDYLQNLENLLLKTPSLRGNKTFSRELRQAQKSYEEEMNRIYGQVHQLAQNQSKIQHFTNAIQYYKKFAEKHSNPWKNNARKEIQKINQQAKKSLEKLSEKTRVLSEQGEKERAVAIAKEAYPHYEGTLWREDIGLLIQSLEKP